MQHSLTAVKVPAQRPTRRERFRTKVLNKIARLTLARNKAIKTIVQAEVQLPKLERQARRLERPVVLRKPKPVEHPKVAARETKVANELVEFSAKLTTPEALAVATGEAKPKRKPRAKADGKLEAGSPGPKLLEEMLNKPFVEARKKREAKMKAMGFRKT